MQCLLQIQHHRGMMVNAVTDAVSSSRSRNENIIVVIAAKSFVPSALAKLVLCPSLASRKRFVPTSEVRLNAIACSLADNIYLLLKVRVCDGCFTQLQKPNSGTKRGDELPAEYVNSSLAQQSQVSVRFGI